MLPPRRAGGLGSVLLPVVGLGWDDVADAAAGIGDVAGVARDDVEVELGHGLAGGEAIVEAEIESVGCGAEVRSQVLLRPVDPHEEPGLFDAGQVLEKGHGPAGDDQSMAVGDWELVGDDGEEIIQGENSGWLNFSEGGELQGGVQRERNLLHGLGQYLVVRYFSRQRRLSMAG